MVGNSSIRFAPKGIIQTGLKPHSFAPSTAFLRAAHRKPKGLTKEEWGAPMRVKTEHYLYAIEKGKWKKAEAYLKAGVKMGSRNVEGTPDFLVATTNRQMKTAHRLLFINPKVIDSRNKMRLTALMLACLHVDYKMVQFLLERGANLGAIDKKGWTPLHHAAASGDLPIIRLLREFGADPSAKDFEDNPPAIIARTHKHFDAQMELEEAVVSTHRSKNVKVKHD